MDILTIENYEAQGFITGEEAASALAQSAPDVIITDINLPGMSGIDLMKDVRKHETYNSIPVIFISARIDMVPPDLGPLRVLKKPFHVADLIAVVKELVGPPP